MSISLILTSFVNDIKNKQKTNDSEEILRKELNSLTNNIIKQKKLEKIVKTENFKEEIEEIINKNNKFIKFIKNFIKIDKKDINDHIKNLKEFKNGTSFSKEKYNDFLKKIKLNEKNFKKKIKQILVIKQIKQGIKLSNPALKINNLIKTSKKINIKYIISKNHKPNKINKEKISNFYLKNKTNLKSEHLLYIEYLNISTKELINNIKLTEKIKNSFYKKNKKRYIKNNLINIKYFFLPKKFYFQKNIEEINNFSNSNDINFDKKYYNFLKNEQYKKSNNFIRLLIEDNTKNKIEKIFLENKSKIIKTNKGIYIIEVINKEKKKKYNKEKIYKDLENSIKKEKAEKYIFLNIEKIANSLFEEESSINNTAIKFDLNIKNIIYEKNIKNKLFLNNDVNKLLNNKEFIKKNINSNLIKINNLNYLIIKITKTIPKKQLEYKDIKKNINMYLNYIENEKEILINYKEIKNNKTNTKWIYSNNMDENIPKEITRIIENKNKNKYIKIFKNKKEYFIIKKNSKYSKKIRNKEKKSPSIYYIYKKYINEK